MFHVKPHSIVYNKVTDTKSMTIPSRAFSVREIMDRYRSTGILVDSGNPIYGDDLIHQPDADLIDRYSYAREVVLNQKKEFEEQVRLKQEQEKKLLDDEINRRVAEKLAAQAKE